MNSKTKYVRMHIVNYEPSYRDLLVAVEVLTDDDDPTAARDVLLDSVHANYEAMGLDYDAIDDTDVDYIAIIQEEAGV